MAPSEVPHIPIAPAGLYSCHHPCQCICLSISARSAGRPVHGRIRGRTQDTCTHPTTFSSSPSLSTISAHHHPGHHLLLMTMDYDQRYFYRTAARMSTPPPGAPAPVRYALAEACAMSRSIIYRALIIHIHEPISSTTKLPNHMYYSRVFYLVHMLRASSACSLPNNARFVLDAAVCCQATDLTDS
jgi:hypothetical protein